MTERFSQDIAALRFALECSGDAGHTRVLLSRAAAEELLDTLESHVTSSGADSATEPSPDLSPSDAAKRIGISPEKLRVLMDFGMLNFRRVGTEYRIPLSALQAYEAALRTEGLGDALVRQRNNDTVVMN
jgi:excisionase family DNA binding protein